MRPAVDMPIDFNRYVDRTGTDSAKWEKYKGKDILPLWVADMDFPSPPPVIAALQERAAHGIFGYPQPPEALTSTVQHILQSRYGWSIDAKWLVWLPGVVSGFNIACRAVGDDQDEVLTTVPVYPPFLSAPKNSRRKLITVPLIQRGGRWRVDFDQMKRAITGRTRMLLLCSPHNPVGRVYSRDELTQLVQICMDRGMVICSDEIHCDLVLDADRQHIVTATLGAEVEKQTITLMAPSKTFNIPGLGCAFGVVPDPHIRRRFKAAMNGIVPHVTAMGYAGALAAYRDGWPWVNALIEYLRENRDMVARAVSAMPGVSMTHVEATYLAWIDARDTGLENPAAFFEKAGVGLSDGRDFGGPGFVRLNFGCPQPLLIKALERMRASLVNLR